MEVIVYIAQVSVLWIVYATALNDTTTESPMVTTSDGSYCQGNWTRHGQSCYMRMTDKLDFSHANVSCTENGHLVSISDKEENEFVTRFSNSTDNAWIGLYHQTENCRNHSLCDWMWTDGSKLGYINWQPNAVPAFPECAVIGSNGIWNNNQPCNGILDFICERSVWFFTTTSATMMTTEDAHDRNTTVVNTSPILKSKKEHDDDDNDKPIIIGCVVGGLVLVIIFTVVAIVLLKRHRTSSRNDQPREDKDEETPPVAKHVRYNPAYDDVDLVETQGATNVTFKPSPGNTDTGAPGNTDTGAHGVGDNPHNIYSEAIKKKDRPGSEGILVKENTLYGTGK